MIATGDLPIMQLNLTEDELQVLVFSVVMFNQVVQTAPAVPGMSNRSDRIKQRRASQRFTDRIVSLASSYGMEIP
jgi:hypothetical protein